MPVLPQPPGDPNLASFETGVVVVKTTSTTSLVATGTVTAAMLLGGVIDAVITGAATFTTDTGTAIDAALVANSAAVGDSFTVWVNNRAASAIAITLAGGTGVTLKGSATTIGQNLTGILLFRRTGAATYDCFVHVSA